ncbi:MAG TPA: hypothetical protein VGA97_06720 [Acidimicrobiia bacterium]
MAVETSGIVVMKGETGPGVHVTVIADSGRLRIESSTGVVGDWSVHDIGLHVLDEGFAIRAEGEEFLLKTDDDVGLAEELGVAAASPRMARKLAARHNPEGPLPDEAPVPAPKSSLSAIGVAIAGALVMLGAILINTSPFTGEFDAGSQAVGRVPFWLAFLLGGMLMVGMAYLISIGRRWARPVALLVTALVVLFFGLLVNRGVPEVAALTAYGFVAGGMVIGIAVLVGGEPGGDD